MVERKVYTDEFKREAVRLAVERNNVARTARELGISDSVLTRWKKELTQAEESAKGTVVFPGHGNPRDAEMARLQRENARLREEVEILKKAVGIFTSRPK